MKVLSRTEPELVVRPPCRPIYEHHELRTDGTQLVGVRVRAGKNGGTDVGTYAPSPVWVGQVARSLRGQDLNDLAPATREEVDFLLS